MRINAPFHAFPRDLEEAETSRVFLSPDPPLEEENEIQPLGNYQPNKKGNVM